MATSKQNDGEIIEAEIINEEQGLAPMTISEALEKALGNEIKKFDPYEKRIAELKELYNLEKLAVNGVADKEGRESLRVAISTLRKMWVATDEDRKTIKKPILSAGKSVEDKAQWIISQLQGIAAPLQAKKDELDVEENRIKAEEAAAKNARFITRTQELTRLGATFDGTNFILDGLQFEATTLKGVDDSIYNENVLPKFQEIFDAKEKIRLEAEQLKKDAEEKQRLEKEEMEKQQKDLRDQQEKLLKEQQEMQRKKDEQAREDKIKKDREDEKRWRSRLSELNEIGWNGQYAFKRDDENDSVISYQDLIEFDDEAFGIIRDLHNKLIAEAKEKKRIQDEENARLAEEKRLSDLEQAKKEAATKAIKEAEEKKIQEEKERQEKLELSSDKDKYAGTIQYLKNTRVYAMRSGQYRKKMMVINDFLADLDKI